MAASSQKSTVKDVCPREVLDSVNHMYLQVYGGTCFQFVASERRTYQEADDDCLRHGGTLALPKTADLNDFLTTQSFEHYHISDEIWIGLSDMHDERKFVWEDNTEMEWNNFAKDNGPD